MKSTFAAASSVIDCRNLATPISLLLVPAGGNTCNVFVTLDDDPSDVGAVWDAWDAGPVTGQTSRVIDSPVTGIKATRTVGSASGNVLYVRAAGQARSS